ncbi:helix-turn-helix domain-containing protein [Nesterenkonia ebinurensis]|uniref:helix-turn-helix domain-containing protein n=1 Tax=Nesterenkonia ebinurensis TaxID=2608252 RepID=UPI00123CBA82|nr:cupin domain-containing protein [Nesterenkonia ebinurensis]
MVHQSDSLAMAIGVRVRNHRRGRGWTLDQLSETSGVSRRMLINVEQGSANPSIGTLLKISQALGLVLPALVEPPAPKSVKLTRNGQGAVLWSGSAGGRGVLLSSIRTPDVVEIWDWTFGPKDEHSSAAHSSGTTELLHVLEGTISVSVAGEPHTLSPGDALRFPGDVPHVYKNPSDESARFTMTVFEPVSGHVPPHEHSDE